MTEIKAIKQEPILFVSDLIPARQWIKAAITMGYDRYPELLINEKEKLLKYAYEQQVRLFFTHDPLIESCMICKNEKDSYVEDQESFVYT